MTVSLVLVDSQFGNFFAHPYAAHSSMFSFAIYFTCTYMTSFYSGATYWLNFHSIWSM